jgi:hypothetical protein
MIHLLLGNLVVWAAGLGIGVVWGWEVAARRGEEAPGPAWVLMVVPPLAAWAVAEAVNLLTPRRLFDRRAAAPVRRATLGVLTGVVGFVIAVAALPLVEDALPDWATLTAASAVATAIPTLLLPRTRPGHCALCGYDLRGLPRMDQCPECGRTGVV